MLKRNSIGFFTRIFFLLVTAIYQAQLRAHQPDESYIEKSIFLFFFFGLLFKIMSFFFKEFFLKVFGVLFPFICQYDKTVDNKIKE